MTDRAVIVAGAGPTGLMLGAELTLAGVDVTIVEKRADGDGRSQVRWAYTLGPSRCSTSAEQRTE